MPLPSLPVDDTLPELLRVLAEGPAAVLHAPTGAGKTTRVPPALLDAGYGDVLVLEPRRLAARAAARRIAFERGGRLGDEVGYHVRFDRQAGRSTRLCIMTEGILVRRLQDDPFLEGIGCIVFDEFHERGLDADLALAMARRVQESARDDLRIVVMSATLDTERVAGFLGDCPVVTSTGRLHPVEVRHLPARGREKLDVHITRGVEEVLEHTQGDVLAFLPGVGEIRRAHAALEGIARRSGRDILELYGDLPPERQDAVLRRGARPKLVLATNVAETSVTIEGVTGVVDSGLVRRMRYDTSVGLDRLELGNVSRASADQRTGRAGRTEPGVAVRLWSPMDERALAAHEEPEVRRVDLAGPALQLLCWGEADVSAFPWVEAPRAESLEQALELLARLGATQKGALTELGRRMGRLPIHPRLARMLIEGHERGVTGRAALAAALLSERDPFARRRGPAPDAAESDVLERVRALEDHERGRSHPDLNRNGARFVARAADQFARLAENVLGKSNARGGDEALLRSIFTAFPDRIARRRVRGEARAVQVDGRGVRLAEESAVTEAEFFVCVDSTAGNRGEALVRQASLALREWFDPARIEERVDTFFDAGRGRVVAKRRLALEQLVLEESDHPVTDAELAEELLATAAAADLERALPLSEPKTAGFLARVACLREWMPELELPAFDDEHMRELLPQLVAGRRTLAELAKAPLHDFLRGALTRHQVLALDREAPERLTVPSGSQIRLTYEAGRPPVLAARIQELFGLAATPRVASGRVPVLMHLLAPNRRPQQVTDDLASFWNSTYAVVRKELRRRYPRHAWPEDPWNAQAQKRPKRR